MPEAAMHKGDGAPSWEYQIGASRKLLGMQSETKPSRMKSPPQHQLWVGVLPPNTTHVEPPLSRREHIYHEQTYVVVASATMARRVVAMSGILIPGRMVTAPKRKARRYSG
jgi:hypothetical protein